MDPHPNKRVYNHIYFLFLFSGGTIYPGLMVTSTVLYHFLNFLHISIEVRNVCVFLAPLFSSLTSLVTYFLTSELFSGKYFLLFRLQGADVHFEKMRAWCWKQRVFQNMQGYCEILPPVIRKSLQLKKFETNPYFLQNFQCTTMFISAFCKICELNTEREIVFVFCNVYLLALDNTKR